MIKIARELVQEVVDQLDAVGSVASGDLERLRAALAGYMPIEVIVERCPTCRAAGPNFCTNAFHETEQRWRQRSEG